MEARPICIQGSVFFVILLLCLINSSISLDAEIAGSEDMKVRTRIVIKRVLKELIKKRVKGYSRTRLNREGTQTEIVQDKAHRRVNLNIFDRSNKFTTFR